MATQKGTEIWRGQVRLPAPMIEWVRRRAEDSFRSVNAEFVEVVREAMKQEGKQNAHQ